MLEKRRRIIDANLNRAGEGLHLLEELARLGLDDAGLARSDVDFCLMHQPTLFVINHLRDRLRMDEELLPADLQDYGNTVSSTVPILIRDLRNSGRLCPGKRSLLIGFGVGFSWAGCLWTETWEAQGQIDPGTPREAA